jgi:PAS domain S-box-containing protein
MNSWKDLLMETAWEVFQKAQIIICVVSLDGKTMFLNPWGEKVTGYSLQEIEGKDWWETFYPGNCYEQVQKLFADMKKQSDIENYKMVLRTKKNEQRHIVWSSCNILDGDGSVKFIVGLGTDIAEMREADRKYFEAKSIMTNLILTSGLSNDLNNILSGLAGSSELAVKNLEKEPVKTLEWLEKARKNVAMITELSKRIVAFSRSNDQKIELADFSVLLQEIMAKEKLDHPKIVFECDIGKSLKIPAKSEEVELLINNLLKNAVRASIGGKGKVFVDLKFVNRTDQEGYLTKMLKFTVKDGGCGMDQQILAKMFILYFKDFETPPSWKGAGLGLAIVRQIVSRMKGFIEVESSAGKGSTFSISLPAVK